jgi:cation transport protein ChaC
MVAGAYQPRWLALHTPGNGPDDDVFGHGIAFTIDRASPAYASGLTHAETVHRLATASGELGSSADYLLRTRDGLREVGVADPTIEELADLVIAARAPAR